LQLAPEKPLSQVQEPSEFAVPCPLQVVALPYWQVFPANPEAQAHVPWLVQVPRPWQVPASVQKVHVG
jgi:hypothetical protein